MSQDKKTFSIASFFNYVFLVTLWIELIKVHGYLPAFFTGNSFLTTMHINLYHFAHYYFWGFGLLAFGAISVSIIAIELFLKKDKVSNDEKMKLVNGLIDTDFTSLATFKTYFLTIPSLVAFICFLPDLSIVIPYVLLHGSGIWLLNYLKHKKDYCVVLKKEMVKYKLNNI